MPTRRPRQRARDTYNDDEENGSSQERDAPFSPSSGGGEEGGGKRAERRLLASLVESRVGEPLGREPRNEEEKRGLYLQLVRLKAARKTHKECAEAMGVSVSTITNYSADPLYKEMQAELVAEAKDRGHVLIGELIDHSLEGMVALTRAQSEFVRFKALEYILNAAGYNLPREEARRDSQDGLSRFMDILASRRGAGAAPPPSTVVNVEVHTGGGGEETRASFVESSLSDPAPPDARELSERGGGGAPSSSPLPPELAHYYFQQQVLPGGRLPPMETIGGTTSTGEGMRKDALPQGQEQEQERDLS